jgi:chloramphenicol-sensitive protein RarD
MAEADHVRGAGQPGVTSDDITAAKQLQHGRGMIAATGAYLIWGLLPVYWKALESVASYQILAHRMLWSLVLTGCLLAVFGGKDRFRSLFADRKMVLVSTVSGLLLGVNWLTYIWAVNSGYIVEASLGYYINPLVTVTFAVLILGERLRFGQMAALLLAVLGVVYLTVVYGRFPWIALLLAMTFAVYGLLHKMIRIAPLKGLFLETLVFFLPATAMILFAGSDGRGAFITGGWSLSLLLIGTGVITTIPLLLFAYAAHNIKLSLLGILQYTAPTLNLLLGIFVYHEEFPGSRMVGFLLVWSALFVFVIEGMSQRSRLKKAVLVQR